VFDPHISGVVLYGPYVGSFSDVGVDDNVNSLSGSVLVESMVDPLRGICIFVGILDRELVRVGEGARDEGLEELVDAG
jgi:hypothetical protein